MENCVLSKYNSLRIRLCSIKYLSHSRPVLLLYISNKAPSCSQMWDFLGRNTKTDIEKTPDKVHGPIIPRFELNNELFNSIVTALVCFQATDVPPPARLPTIVQFLYWDATIQPNTRGVWMVFGTGMMEYVLSVPDSIPKVHASRTWLHHIVGLIPPLTIVLEKKDQPLPMNLLVLTTWQSPDWVVQKRR